MPPQVLIVVGLLPETGRAQFAVELNLGNTAQMQLLVAIELLGVVELNAANVAVVAAAQTGLVGEHVEVQFPECLHNIRTVWALERRYIVVHEVHLIVVDIVRDEFLAQALAIEALHLLLGVIEAQLGDAFRDLNGGHVDQLLQLDGHLVESLAAPLLAAVVGIKAVVEALVPLYHAQQLGRGSVIPYGREAATIGGFLPEGRELLVGHWTVPFPNRSYMH